ncbi:MAG: hypothetical protein HUU55_08100 [Myxococcales bacterium]|nr:hypothetical protein [Myxococcales bacterium]
MYLPRSTSAPTARLRHAKYAARSLRRAGFDTESTTITAAANVVRSKLADAQKADDHLSEMLADRDHVDSRLDDVGGEFRLAIGSRTSTAMTEKPYTDIFHQGAQWVLTAPIDENSKRYEELLARAEEYLTADDLALITLQQKLPPLLIEWKTQLQNVDNARTKLALALAAVDTAEEDYDRVVEKTAALLTAELGKSKVQRLFRAVDR